MCSFPFFPTVTYSSCSSLLPPIVLYYPMLFPVELLCSLLFSFVPWCFLLPLPILYCPLLFYIAFYCSILPHIVFLCSLFFFVPCCSLLPPGVFLCSFMFSFVPCCSLLPPIGFPYSVLSLLVPIDTQSIHNTNDVWNNYMTLQWNVAISLLLMILKHICCNFIGEVSAHRFLWI